MLGWLGKLVVRLGGLGGTFCLSTLPYSGLGGAFCLYTFLSSLGGSLGGTSCSSLLSSLGGGFRDLGDKTCLVFFSSSFILSSVGGSLGGLGND